MEWTMKKVWTAVAAAATVTVAVVTWSVGVRAFNPQPDPPGFGLIGIGLGQTLQLTVVNTAGLLSGVPPGPCRVEIGLIGADGAFLSGLPDANGASALPLHKGGLLRPGESLSIAVSAASVATDASGRLQVRPAWVNGPGAVPPGPCRASVDVIDDATGKTAFSIPAVRIALPAVQ
jgi:hypothetical protein